jgi:2,4-dienoyl-CoA reductase-like NADH-dependent reductase (Old Yellow Enzyme family)
MWRPPSPIKHELPPLRAPSADEAARSLLFSPLTLRSGLVLRDRAWVPAMVPWRASDDGLVTDAVLAWYARFAEGRPGTIVVEATGIRDVPSGPLLRIGHDRFVPGLARIVDAVRAASGGHTRLFIQVIDFLRIRRRPPEDRFFSDFLVLRPEHRARLAELERDEIWLGAPEPDVRRRLAALDESGRERVLVERELEALRMGARERVTDVHEPLVRELPRVLPTLFADAAARAEQAGFDGVELHYAHAYTMASFLSARNTRADGYGGSREGRARLPLEVHAAVRARVSGAFAVGCRILCDEIIEGGSDVADASYFAAELARAGMDFVSLSTGGKFEDAEQPKVGEAAYPYTGRSGYECMPTRLSDARGPFGRSVPKQALVRRAVRDAGLDTPVVVAGGLHDFDQVERILRRGEGDLIGAARQSLADPDWFQKLREGRGAEIRRCLYTNYCEALDQRHRAVTCQRWDRDALDEPGALTTDGGRRRLVAPREQKGGGVPGVER